MEHNQPPKKRFLEEPSQSSSNVQCHNGQVLQYMHVTESSTSTLQPNIQQQQLQHQIQQPVNVEPHIIHVDLQKPMTVETWTQTDEFDEPPKFEDLEPQEKINYMQKNIDKYKSMLGLTNDSSSDSEDSPSCPVFSNTPTTSKSSTTNHEKARYRILAQSESNSDIEITVAEADELQTSDIEISSAEVYTVQEGTPAMVQQIYGHKAYTPLSPQKPSTSQAALASLVESTTRTPPEPKAKATPPIKTAPPKIITEAKKGSMVSIGPNDTLVPADDFANVDWKTPSTATRKLLSLVFDRETLATHSMTGKPSPAFKEQNKPIKKRLDPDAVQDIIYMVSRKCSVPEKEVRTAITTKCADENKMLKLKMMKEMEAKPKQSPLKDANQNKENKISKIK